MTQTCDLTSAGASRMFNMANKRRMAEGWDPDLTLIDLKARRGSRHEHLSSRCGWTPFDGFEATGWPMAAIVHGRVVMSGGELVGAAHGRRVRFQDTLPARGAQG